jgi:hypothetical protein
MDSSVTVQTPNLGKSTEPSPSLLVQENPNTDQSTVQLHPPPANRQSPTSSPMANFDVNPVPYIPMGFDLQHWV